MLVVILQVPELYVGAAALGRPEDVLSHLDTGDDTVGPAGREREKGGGKRWVHGWMDRWMDGQADGWTDRQTDRQTMEDCWMDGWTDGRRDRPLDRQIHNYVNTQTEKGRQTCTHVHMYMYM